MTKQQTTRSEEYQRLENQIYDFYDVLTAEFRGAKTEHSASELQRKSIKPGMQVIDSYRAGKITQSELESLDSLLGTIWKLSGRISEVAWLKIREERNSYTETLKERLVAARGG
jgi:hypothetical protein